MIRSVISRLKGTSELANVIFLSEQKIQETMKNSQLTRELLEVAQLARSHERFTPTHEVGKLLYSIVTATPDLVKKHSPLLVDYVVKKKITKITQIEAALDYLSNNQTFSQELFVNACGIGTTVTQDRIETEINQIIQQKGRNITIGTVIGTVRSTLMWADPLIIKRLAEPKLTNTHKLKQKTETNKLSNLIGRELASAVNPPELLAKHREFTKGKTFTRFPPEPNGHLHLGHAKALRFNFLIPEATSGYCYLRFDDSNPEKSTQEHITNIQNHLNWLGYTPYLTTFTSDYFPEILRFAIQLIEKGKAYVDFQSKTLINEQRENCVNSPFRNTSIQENLTQFNLMRKGEYEEGGACLRMKINMTHPNPCMRDPVAYRIKHMWHPHVGNNWCVYPTYDMSHCIVDSLENITHSLCTLEFEIKRDSYYWLLEQLELYRPNVWEYSRLNVTHNVMSKRKLAVLVKNQVVYGWDDPRLFTLSGLKRRGVTPQAINEFIDRVGFARTGNENFISYELLEFCVRKHLNEIAPRTLAVLEPLKIILLNLDNDFQVEAPLFPGKKAKGSYLASVSRELYIEKADFQQENQDGFHGLCPGQTVGLKYLPFHINFIAKTEEGILCEVAHPKAKPLSSLH